MSKHIRSSGLRAAFEQIFAGVAFAAVVAVIFAGTAAMCFPASSPRRPARVVNLARWTPL